MRCKCINFNIRFIISTILATMPFNVANEICFVFLFFFSHSSISTRNCKILNSLHRTNSIKASLRHTTERENTWTHSIYVHVKHLIVFIRPLLVEFYWMGLGKICKRESNIILKLKKWNIERNKQSEKKK